MTPAEGCWNSLRNWTSLVSLWRMWLEKVSYLLLSLSFSSPTLLFCCLFMSSSMTFASACPQGSLGRSIVAPWGCQGKNVSWLPSRPWSRHIQTHSGGTFCAKQQLWGNSITRTLCVWKELSPKVRLCGRESWNESRNWHICRAFLREDAVREVMLGEDSHCHVTLWQGMRMGVEVWISNRVIRQCWERSSWVGEWMRSWDDVRDAVRLYVWHKKEYKIIGGGLSRRVCQLCQWSGGIGWGWIWFSVLGQCGQHWKARVEELQKGWHFLVFLKGGQWWSSLSIWRMERWIPSSG